MEANYHKQDWTGSGQWKELAKELSLLGKRINNIHGSNGVHVFHDWSGIKISGNARGGGSGWSSGIVRWRGTTWTGLNTDTGKLYLKCDMLGSEGIVENDGPPPQTDGQYLWIEKASLSGNIPTIPER